MAQLIVRNLEEEVRDILRNAVKVDGKRQVGLGSELKRVFQGIGLKKDIPELKGSNPKTADFES